MNASEIDEPKEDAAMKAADAIVNVATGGEHLSWKKSNETPPSFTMRSERPEVLFSRGQT
jgi:hypothetical protein